MNIKIQSLTDIITNSSSETFVIFDSSGVEEVKKIVNSILKIAGAEYTFDDLFDVEFMYDEEFAEECYEDDGGQEGTGLSLKEYIERENERILDYREGHPWITGIDVIAKSDAPVGTEEAARLLSNIGFIFGSDTFYC